MENCIFCKIAVKEVLAEVIYEDNEVFAFLDGHPIAPGHTLVIPKIHTETLLDMDAQRVGPYFERVQQVLGMVREGLRPDGFTLGINHGKWAGQAVDHMHFHIIPRWQSDGGKSIHSVVLNTPKEDLEVIAKKIRKE